MCARSKSLRGFTAVELLVVVAIVAILIALLLPAVQQAREAGRRSQCKNNMKQLGLAMHNYYDTFSLLPPGWIAKDWKPATGACWGWGTMILPYIDQAPLYNRVDFKRPPAVGELTQEMLAVYRCPTDISPNTNAVRGNFGTSNYVGNYGSQALPGSVDAAKDANGLFYCNSSVNFRSVEDGLSTTIMVGERSLSSAAAIWVGVRSNQNGGDNVSACSEQTRINSVIGAFTSRHVGGATFLLGDGSVRFVSEKLDPKVWEALGTRAGGENIGGN
jgi:prepilin-type N-terminal cleavage/methylation domain-containing protein